MTWRWRTPLAARLATKAARSSACAELPAIARTCRYEVSRPDGQPKTNGARCAGKSPSVHSWQRRSIESETVELKPPMKTTASVLRAVAEHQPSTRSHARGEEDAAATEAR